MVPSGIGTGFTVFSLEKRTVPAARVSRVSTPVEVKVLVTDTGADPVQVHAYLDTLCQQVPTRLYGTLTVPKAA